jgi:phosphohistidine phosphatase
MKTLFLLRHAKSSWKDATLPDFDRPLSGRGTKAAELVASFMSKKKVVPELILSSPAVRTRQTADIIIKTAKFRAELRYDQRIYEAGPVRLLEVISEIDQDKKRVMLVGHNPGLEELLHMLTGRVEQMPTATLVKISLTAVRWAKAVERGATIDWVMRPKELG